MSPWEWVAVIITGGTGIPLGVILTCRALVYRDTDPARGDAYLTWFREEKAREQHANVRPQVATPAPRRRQVTAAPRPKELTRR